MSSAEVDRIRRFHVPALSARGAWVHLDSAWRSVGAAHDYPAPVQVLLGQALAATALLAGNLKSPGRLSLHLKSGGGVLTLFAECDERGQVRGIARLAEGFAPESPIDLAALPEAVFGLTLERPDHERYQGLVEVSGASLSQVLEGYFARSEQLPTRLWLASDPTRCAGLLLQQLASPGAGGLPGGAATVATSSAGPAEAGSLHPAFEEAAMLAATVSSGELLDLDSETLLRRLFAEHDKHLAPASELSFACTCSRERVGRMFLSLGQGEAFAALRDNRTEVRCEFCNRLWAFDRVDLAQLFAAEDSLAAGCTPPVGTTAH